MNGPAAVDIVIIGGGPAGLIALAYARMAGFTACLLERQHTLGGLWARLPAWQDIQNREEDWTLGDIPITGVDQPCILANIREWARRFELDPYIRLGTPALSARPTGSGWEIDTPAGTIRSRVLISASGVHNVPLVPLIARANPAVAEFHSSGLHDPSVLAGRKVVVVGGGASAFDLLDLAIANDAAGIAWVYRSLKWMTPTRRPKRFASNVRLIARMQMQGQSNEQISAAIDADLRDRYHKLGIADILPDHPFDIGSDQLIPGRWRMITGFAAIGRHCSEPVTIEGRSVVLGSGARIEADVLLWGTGYRADLGYLAPVGLDGITHSRQLAPRCGSLVMSLDAPNLYFMSVGLESTSASPWHFAHLARTIMAHLRGEATLGPTPVLHHLNYFGVPRFLAGLDPTNFPADSWQQEYAALADRPEEQPMPIPPLARRSGGQLPASA